MLSGIYFSVLLNEIYYVYLLADGVPSDHIIKVSLDLKKWEALRNGDMLYHYIAEAIHDDELYYRKQYSSSTIRRMIRIQQSFMDKYLGGVLQ